MCHNLWTIKDLRQDVIYVNVSEMDPWKNKNMLRISVQLLSIMIGTIQQVHSLK